MSYPQQPGNWSDPAAAPSPGSGAPYDPLPYPGYQSPEQQAPVGQYQPPAAQYQAPAGYPGYGYPGYGYPVVVNKPTNGLAIASMVVAIVGALGLCGYGLGGYIGIVGAILGHVAKRQIKERDEGGDGMALAGIIVGWIAGAIAVLATIGIIVLIVVSANDPNF